MLEGDTRLRSATGIHSDGYFHRACAICGKKNGGKSRQNLVEHQIIKNDEKI